MIWRGGDEGKALGIEDRGERKLGADVGPAAGWCDRKEHIGAVFELSLESRVVKSDIWAEQGKRTLACACSVSDRGEDRRFVACLDST